MTSPTYIAGASSDGTYFVDQNGAPKFFVCEDIWGLLINAGLNTSDDWQSDISAYLADRSAQGYTALECSVMSTAAFSAVNYTDGRDYDGLWPFTSTNNPSSGLNNSFWTKRDYLIETAQTYGMTVVLSLTGPLGSGGLVDSWTTQQWTDYGTHISARYASMPNLIYTMGDDYFGTDDSGMAAMRTALRAGGDNHLFTIQGYQETTSRTDIPTGDATSYDGTWAEVDWVYTYNVTYLGLERACAESSRVPAVWGDGNYLASSGTTQADAHLERNMIWWALSSGACGFSTGDNDTWQWASGSAAIVTNSFYADQIASIISTFKSLVNWQKLRPDASGTLVTAGRGTPAEPIATGGAGTYYTDDSDTYVTVAWDPAGSLAVIYFSHHETITVDQSKMHAGYTATWVDPASGATSTATPGSSYTSSGTNSAGDEDWVLVLAAPPVKGSALLLSSF